MRNDPGDRGGPIRIRRAAEARRASTVVERENQNTLMTTDDKSSSDPPFPPPSLPTLSSRKYLPYITGEPVISSHVLSPSLDLFLVLASDSLWERLSNEDANGLLA